ncbi:hypothetical protein [Mycobacterium tuberculosis]|uniref:hypothetical protein n=1 Tax=Mycobacterium tuberculosis TaxID=1773 RepID=UPI003D7E7846
MRRWHRGWSRFRLAAGTADTGITAVATGAYTTVDTERAGGRDRQESRRSAGSAVTAGAWRSAGGQRETAGPALAARRRRTHRCRHSRRVSTAGAGH